MFEVAARLRRGSWGVRIAGFLLALDGLIVPAWAAWFVGYLGGGPATVDVLGTVLPTWVCLGLGPMAILSVGGVVVLARTRNELGYHVACVVTVAWIAFVGLAVLAGAVPIQPFLGRVGILAFLVQGRTIQPRHIAAL